MTILGARIRQDLALEGLEVGINESEFEPIEFVDFGQPRAEQSTAQLKLDTWVFLFMNVYAVFGKIDGEAQLELAVPGNALLDFLGLGAICSPPIGRPPSICEQTLVSQVTSSYNAQNVGVGANWDVSKRWSVMVESGVGGSRENLIAGLT